MDQQIKELVTLIYRLCNKLPQDDPIRIKALDYLKRKDLTPSPLRNIRGN